MNDLILHIGTTKTGTSALQQFFFENRDRLAERDVAYPVFLISRERHKGETGTSSTGIAMPGQQEKTRTTSLTIWKRTLIS